MRRDPRKEAVAGKYRSIAVQIVDETSSPRSAEVPVDLFLAPRLESSDRSNVIILRERVHEIVTEIQQAARIDFDLPVRPSLRGLLRIDEALLKTGRLEMLEADEADRWLAEQVATLQNQVVAISQEIS